VISEEAKDVAEVFHVWVAMIWHTDVIKMSVSIRLKTDWSFLLFVVQHKSRYREVVRILHRENTLFRLSSTLQQWFLFPK
jgi:ketopantoate reductase